MIISIYTDFLRFCFPLFYIRWLMGYNWKPFFFSGDWLRTPLADWSCLFLSICFCKYSFKSLHPL